MNCGRFLFGQFYLILPQTLKTWGGKTFKLFLFFINTDRLGSYMTFPGSLALCQQKD